MKTTRRKFMLMSGMAITAPAFSGLISSCSSDEVVSLQNLTQGVIPIDESDYEMRLKKLHASMERSGVEALFIEGATNLKYFFNVSWWQSERVFGAIVNLKSEPVWVCPAFELERASEIIPETHRIVTWEEHESPYRLFSSIVNELGLKDSAIGMGPFVRSFISEGVRRELPAGLVDGSDAVNRVRAIKSEKEIACMDLANNITKRAYKYGFERLSEGMAAGDLSQLIRDAHSAMGMTGGGSPQFGFTSAFPHGTRERRDLHAGDNILVDGGGAIEGFRSDVTRTIIFGEPSDRQKRVFDVVLAAQQAAHKAIRPGVTCGEIDRVARKTIEDAGFGPGYKYFAHRLGHGIGMDVHEYPYLVKDSQVVLEPGMTFSNEPGIYIYGEFGIRIEDCFVVTEDGAKMLGGMFTEGIDRPFGS
jgi:Xaa-Pro dipeptidase